MKKSVILLITIVNIINGQDRFLKYNTNPTILREMRIVDDYYLKEFPKFTDYHKERENKFIIKLQKHMELSEMGKYPKRKTENVLNIAKRYVELEKNYEAELLKLRKELENEVK